MPVIVDNRGFHRNEKQATMVDEISLAHVLREGNSFVRNGWSYGQALTHYLLEKGMVQGGKPRILEVGPGPGDLAAAAIPTLLEVGKDLSYTMLDIAPHLIAEQTRKTHKWRDRVRHVSGDAEKADKLVAGADLVICNEVLADFRTLDNIPKKRGGKPTGIAEKHPRNQQAWGLAWDMIEKYGLDVPRRLLDNPRMSFAINYGAIKFLEALDRVLPPGGAAYVSEFTSEYAKPVSLPGHTEYSISESHFEKTLTKLGFKWEKGGCNDFLGIKHNNKAVDIAQVNLWLMMKDDPYMGVPQEDDTTLLSGRQFYHEEIRHALTEFRRDPRKYTKLDRAVTPQEYDELRKKNGWDVERPQTLPVGADDFTYYLIRKPGPDVKLKELH
ncbi:class I SAM-dependent methyltransferase [Candidatus Altiarchaeota archaeon]